MTIRSAVAGESVVFTLMVQSGQDRRLLHCVAFFASARLVPRPTVHEPITLTLSGGVDDHPYTEERHKVKQFTPGNRNSSQLLAFPETAEEKLALWR